MHWTIRLIYAIDVCYWLLLLFFQHENVWIVAVKSCLTACFASLQVVYMRLHVVWYQVGRLKGSLLPWQLFVLVIVYAAMGILLPTAGYEKRAIVDNLFTTMNLLMPVMLDACNTSRIEARSVLTMLFVSCIFGIFINKALFADAQLWRGIQLSYCETKWVGAFSKNDIRVQCLFGLLMLTLVSLVQVFQDRANERMFLVKDWVNKHDFLGAGRQSVLIARERSNGLTLHIKLLISIGCVFTCHTSLWGNWARGDVKDPWYPAGSWLLLIVWLSVQKAHLKRHLVRSRLDLLKHSLFVWQVVIMLLVNALMTIIWHHDGFIISATADALLTFAVLTIPVHLDACNTTKADVRTAYLILSLGTFFTVICNSVIWCDIVVSPGFLVQQGDISRRVFVFTKNEIRRSCMSTLTLLMLGASFRVFVKDPQNKNMLMVRYHVNKRVDGSFQRTILGSNKTVTVTRLSTLPFNMSTLMSSATIKLGRSRSVVPVSVAKSVDVSIIAKPYSTAPAASKKKSASLIAEDDGTREEAQSKKMIPSNVEACNFKTTLKGKVEVEEFDSFAP